MVWDKHVYSDYIECFMGFGIFPGIYCGGQGKRMMSAKPKFVGRFSQATARQPQQTSSRRSTTESVKTDVDEEEESQEMLASSYRNGVAPPNNQLKGEVCGGHCLVCNDRVFIRPSKELLTEPESRLSLELRTFFYECYGIPMDPDFVQTKSIKSEFPLCYSCSFHLGQLKSMYERLKELNRDFIKFQETVAFSIVDIVAGAVPKRPLLNFAKLKPETMHRIMLGNEANTVQNWIYSEWHNKVPTYPEYDNVNIPNITPIIENSPTIRGRSSSMNPPAATQIQRPVVTKTGNGKPGKKTIISITTGEDGSPALSPSPSTSSTSSTGKRIKLDPSIDSAASENGHNLDDEGDGEGNDIDVEYDYYNQDQKLYQDEENEELGEDDGMAADEGEEDLQHFATQGHFMDANGGGGQWVEGEEEEEYQEYEQLYDDAGFNEGEDGEGKRLIFKNTVNSVSNF